jgi:hypothetical protein
LENSNWLTGPKLAEETGQVIGYREEYVGETEEYCSWFKFVGGIRWRKTRNWEVTYIDLLPRDSTWKKKHRDVKLCRMELHGPAREGQTKNKKNIEDDYKR